MPVPRLFEAAPDPADQWVHVLGTILQLGGPETRAALVLELCGEKLEGTDGMQVSERRPFGSGADAVVVDLVLRSGSDWAVGVVSGLGFGVDRSQRIAAAWNAIAGTGVADPRLVVLTPDRKPTPEVEQAAQAHNVVHKSWLRVRDWVQERPERGAAQGVDLAILREAEYFYTPRVAELYRLEGLAPMVAPEVRESFAQAFFDLNELAPAPTILNPTEGTAVVRFPRTGDPVVTLSLGTGDPALAVVDGPSATLAGPADYTAARSGVVAAARAVLPHRK
ncbi:MAG: hypothetical protein U0Y82_08205 [Thermoleophilia bacterium]